MSNPVGPSIFSRLILVVVGLGVIGLTYWLIITLLAPAMAPPPLGSRGSVTFDPKLDVSRNELFFRMRPLGPLDPNRATTGRPNPFVPPVPQAFVTSTMPVVVTSTELLLAVPTTTTPEQSSP